MNPKKVLIAALISFFSICSYGQKLVEVWRTGPVMKTPESVLYDAVSGLIYVANINENPSEKDGNGYISQLNTDGTVKNMEWVTGLSAPKGMAVFEGKLYVADIDELVEIDIRQGKIARRYPAPGAIFLNDVAVTTSGMVFVSDSRTNKIHLLHQGQFTVWHEGGPLSGINGLYTEDDKLYIGSQKIQVADIKTKAIKDLQDGCQGIDGLEKDRKGNFVFSNWAGRIFYLEDGKMTKMWDSTEQKINTADLFFAKELNLLLVPTFFDNQVVAYQISY
ncbi:SMP-30/gluconolactonase/LRE family protein [Gaoshiqia sp. Z1-71]|uniref:SMP-30/gluconolactonase/LRE family protein n=1 Tax=Gaoshiqia hydrogeniformans TaxID=3290090 RepID=UPI003BF907D8